MKRTRLVGARNVGAVECDGDIRNGNEEKCKDEIGHEFMGEDSD